MRSISAYEMVLDICWNYIGLLNQGKWKLDFIKTFMLCYAMMTKHKYYWQIQGSLLKKTYCIAFWIEQYKIDVFMIVIFVTGHIFMRNIGSRK